MITLWFMTVGEHIANFFLGLFPADFEVPEWFIGAAGLMNELFANAVGLGAWVPWQALLLIITFVIGLWSVGLVIKVVRWLVGIIPTMGGG